MTRGAVFPHVIELNALGTDAPTAKTIATDRLALDTDVAIYIVDGEAGADDDIDGISGYNAGQFCILRAATGRTHTLKDENAGAAAAADRIRTLGGGDQAFTDDEPVFLYHDETLDRWLVVAGPPVEIFISKEILFSALSDSPATGDIVDGFPNGIKLPDSDERGTLTAISAWATCDDGNKGTGTNTIDIEVDSSQAFASPTVLFTITLGTASFAEDTSPAAWTPGTDKFIRAKWNTANASPPEKVRVGVVLKERAEAV